MTVKELIKQLQEFHPDIEVHLVGIDGFHRSIDRVSLDVGTTYIRPSCFIAVKKGWPNQ